jgi:hypothetical protein
MRAILFLEGTLFRLYTLEVGGENEVKALLSRANEQSCGAHIRGFIDLIRRLGDYGSNELTNEQFKCWRPKKKKRLFCELRKGPWRIGNFQVDQRRIVLTTVFRKSRRQESEEYDRAVRYISEFLANPVWEE